MTYEEWKESLPANTLLHASLAWDQISALRVCLQGLLQERNVVVHCPDIVYDPIRKGFGSWKDCVSNKDIAEASLLL